MYLFQGETLLSPLVMCGPHGLKFLKPVELRLPHCASMTPDGWSFALKSSDSSSGTLSSLCPFGVGALGWLCDKLMVVGHFDFYGFIYLVFQFNHSLIHPLIFIYLMWSSDQSSSCHCFFMLKHISFCSFLHFGSMSSV